MAATRDSRDELVLSDWSWLAQGSHQVGKRWPDSARNLPPLPVPSTQSLLGNTRQGPSDSPLASELGGLHQALPTTSGRLAHPVPTPGLTGFVRIAPVQSPDVRTSRIYEVGKRLFDIGGSAAGLIVLAPLFAVLALLIKLGDGGPVIHRREIIGRGGCHVYAYKFRTMIPDADAYLMCHPELLTRYAVNMKLQCDPRVTRIGVWLRHSSLDELPQLLNVLRGEMSLVGPRMIHPSEEARYGCFATVRQRVRPGMTGLWQVSGRQGCAYDDRIGLDQQYLRQRTFWFDMWILARTVVVVVRRQGAV